MSSSDFKYLYGPVPSRRLGRSLGIDLVPFKTCTYDCIYCQLGRTTNKTIERRPYVPIEDILSELKIKLATGERPNFISIAGSGEPTLHSAVGELIGMIKKMTTIPVAVLTNGSLLFLPEVRAALMRADLVIPSLDAGDETMFRYVNRPHCGISFDNMVNGLFEFTRDFPGRVWLEVLLVSGVTGMAAEVEKIAALAKKIGAGKVQLNTVCRPAAEEFACTVEKKQMKNLATLFTGAVDIINDDESVDLSVAAAKDIANEEIFSLLARRPCTLSGICSGLGLHPQDAVKKLKKLLDEKRITTLRTSHAVFYKISDKLL
ncbi:MAG: radical SAM protein [Deltaproteobacteria bacterium HGW-Deltaproteobacteria-12]|nr:MAG: radical SAM protein [Deltaproteobacteria bacterium HGW-Deltaproteobacteria-12]